MKAKLSITMTIALLMSIASVVIVGMASAEYSTVPLNYCSNVHDADNCVNSNGCLQTVDPKGYQCPSFSDNPGANFVLFRNYNLPYSRCGPVNQNLRYCLAARGAICQTKGTRSRPESGPKSPRLPPFQRSIDVAN